MTQDRADQPHQADQADQADQPHEADQPLAARYGLVRPRQGRYVAGVGAALGRATRTDPVLWRVVLAVLVCFAGLGALIYITVWLLTPEESDTASPIESLLGRGVSQTSPVVSGLLGLAVVGLLAIILPRPFYLTLGAALILVVILLINRTRAGAPPPGPPPPGPPPPGQAPPGQAPPGPPPAASAATGGPPTGPPSAGAETLAPPPPSVTPTPTPFTAPWSGPPAGPYPPPGTGPVPGPAPTPVPATTGPTTGPTPAGYRPAFAPHGPFAGPPPLPPPPPPKPPRERSALPAIAFFSTVIVVGFLAGLEVLGLLSIPAAGYVATALAVVGAGLLVGAWLGRGRALIALGVVLALALPAAHAVDTWDRPEHMGGEFSWTPQEVADLPEEYSVMFGTGRLDLRQLDLAGDVVDISVRVTFGEVQVIVPEGAAVEATVHNRFGGGRVLGKDSEGVTRETITDPGSGDPDDGVLRLDLHTRFAGMEVIR